MTTTLAKVTALALLAASFAFSGSLAYADTEDTTSIQILTFDAVGNPGEIIVALDCDTGDGMGNCPVETVVAADTVATTVADAFDPAVLDAAAETTVATDTVELAIQPVDAIVVTGDTAIEGAPTAAIPARAAETAISDETTGDASLVLPEHTGDHLFGIKVPQLTCQNRGSGQSTTGRDLALHQETKGETRWWTDQSSSLPTPGLPSKGG
jgi:hypothetical protein